ncbi:flagellar biosynthesis protein FlgG [Ectobacillus ponti]|uniref:Flagellar biosynthesis protein FlgG n=1 Tax=Ectobacillus ponti TaxID=2961894 RepID=A0AA41X8I6_9BACI|nr:flagellar biosynthesis protein FlgG [Ectobacillus ponti]MCP8968840.1 flagellar biosynthesis protein FlgG [Ectobacillus ponti]
MPDNKEWSAFLGCFGTGYEITVSQEELQARMEALNKWLMSLPAEERKQAAADAETLILKVQRHIRQQQQILEETILSNHSQAFANMRYGRF